VSWDGRWVARLVVSTAAPKVCMKAAHWAGSRDGHSAVTTASRWVDRMESRKAANSERLRADATA